MQNTRQQEINFSYITDELSKVSLFENLPEKILMHFTEKSQLGTQPKGKLLFFHGDEAEWFYVVTKGWVKLFKETIEGSEAVIDVLSKGAVFGEGSIFHNGKHTSSAEMVADTHYIALPTSLLQYYVEKNQQMALNLLSSMSHYQRLQHLDIEQLKVQNAPQRIGCFLLRLCKSRQNDISLNLPYDKTLIAARLGVKPETFSRALSKLKTDTGIEIKGSTITIPNIQKMLDYTCNHCSQSFSCDENSGGS